MSSHLFTKLQAMRISWIEILSTSKETCFYSNSEKKTKNEGCSTKWNSWTVGHNFKQEAFFFLFVPFLSLCLKVSEAFIGSATGPLSPCHLSHTAHARAQTHTHSFFATASIQRSKVTPSSRLEQRKPWQQHSLMCSFQTRRLSWLRTNLPSNESENLGAYYTNTKTVLYLCMLWRLLPLISMLP